MAEQTVFGIRTQMHILAYRNAALRRRTVDMTLREVLVHARAKHPGGTFGKPQIVGWYFRKYVPPDPPLGIFGEPLEGEFIEVPTADDASLASVLVEVSVSA